MSKEKLLDQIRTITQKLSTFDFADESIIEQLNQTFDPTDTFMQEFTQCALQGVKDGWLCDRENGGLKFSRACKPTADFHNFSCDAVWMNNCSGPKHTHPNGELSFCIATDGDPNFDGFKAGWALYKPNTTHIPTVKNGTMLILYFLPDGAMEWN